ncbi:MAG: peptidoglycan D,D-transpeptidase FtsI family protein, partial [Actinomycetota bacterium]
MNRSVRRVAFAIGCAFFALLVQLNYDQVFASRRFAEHPANRRLLVKEYSTQRGDIIASGAVIGRSVATDDKLKYLRNYPLGSLTAEITGFYSLVFGGAGLERAFNPFLAGRKPVEVESLVDDLLGRDRKGNSLVLTLDLEMQRIAQRMLGRQRGAVAALDPATGAVLALSSNPTYDPNALSSHNTGSIRRSWDFYNADPLRPLVARSFQERYPPGSTFKILVSAAALEAGVRPEELFPNPIQLDLPLTNRNLGNFGGRACRSPDGSRISFADGLRVSCNTTFAQIGMRIGQQRLAQMAGRFGFGRQPEFDLPAVASCLRAATRGCDTQPLDAPQTALSSIGQFSVRVSPLQMAMVTAAVANGGTLVRPHLVREVQDFSGNTVVERTFRGEGPIFSATTAATLKQMMIDVVERGTGRSARIAGVQIGGKTGTAETG